MKPITGYELSRNWFDFCFENPEKISPNHSAIYFFAIEHCNRLGWKEKFGFPTQMTMDAIGIKKHQTYIRYFTDLCEWGFIKLIQKSTNQYSSNIISLLSAIPKNGKALDKAFITHAAKQTEPMRQSTGQSNSSIDKQQTINKITSEQGTPVDLSNSNLFRKPNIPTFDKVHEVFLNHGGTKEMAEKFFATNSATEWFYRGSPIKTFSSLVPSFIQAWKKSDGTLPQPKTLQL